MVRLRNTVEFKQYYGAKRKTIERAKELRKKMTKAERILWEKLRKKALYGIKFRRQQPIDRFIVDFYCHSANLVIEIDGEIHSLKENKEYDEYRTCEIEEFGLKILRFSNDQVINNIEYVLEEISKHIRFQGDGSL